MSRQASPSTGRAYGLARVSTSTGEMLPLPANDLIRNGGANSSITSLSGDADHFYGSGYHYGPGGNLEGTFAADWSTGAIQGCESMSTRGTRPLWIGSAAAGSTCCTTTA